MTLRVGNRRIFGWAFTTRPRIDWGVIMNAENGQGVSLHIPRRTSLSSYRCTYSKMWIRTKYYWDLKLQSSEKSALQSLLNPCSS